MKDAKSPVGQEVRREGGAAEGGGSQGPGVEEKSRDREEGKRKGKTQPVVDSEGAEGGKHWHKGHYRYR